MKLVILIGCVVFTALLVSMPRPALAQQAGNPVDLFNKLYPVFSHPRCINCHGVVQSHPEIIFSVTGKTHPGGFVGDPDEAVTCGSCHNDPDILETAWKFTAPQSMWWVNKNAEELCVMQADQVRGMNNSAGSASAAAEGSYMNHLTTDPLVTQAFNGLAGGQRRPPADPPPLKRLEFLAAAQAWVDAGAPCRPSGYIFQVETFATGYTYPSSSGTNGKVTVRESAKRDVHITRYPDGKARANVLLSGHRTIVNVYNDVGESGPCTVTITAKNDWVSKNPDRVEATVDVKVHDRDYEISFVVPPDKTQQSSETHLVSDCGIRPLNTSNVDEPITWEPWRFTIKCPATFALDADNTITCDPRQAQKQLRAAGNMTRTMLDSTDGNEPQSWLRESPTGTTRADNGRDLPITVKTTWFLKLSN